MFLVVATLLSATSLPGDAFLWGCPYKPCGPGDPHTVCIYPAGINRFGEFCMGRGAKVRKMTDEMRKRVLDSHNVFRQKVATGDTDPKQPPAANMLKLKYNVEAERVVQHWLNACQEFSHDSCRSLQDGTPAGQNLYASPNGYSSDNETEAEEKVWYEQVKLYYDEIQYLPGRTPEQVENFVFIHDAGHYTAMIWADVTAVGCAWVEGSTDYSNPHFTSRPIKAGCNYVGTPNAEGGANYLVGDNCTQCPEGAHCSVRYPGLCTFETEEEEYSEDLSRAQRPPEARSVLVSVVVVFALSIKQFLQFR